MGSESDADRHLHASVNGLLLGLFVSGFVVMADVRCRSFHVASMFQQQPRTDNQALVLQVAFHILCGHQRFFNMLYVFCCLFTGEKLVDIYLHPGYAIKKFDSLTKNGGR